MLKPGPLDAAERLVMQQHPDQARDLLAKIPYLQSCIDIPYCHHEYWDGSGYPRGLKGEAIPLAARLFTLVDHWEELSCDRPFRQAWAPGKVLRYIQENAGRLYDPELTRIFIELVKADAPDSPQALTEVVHPIQRTG
jgi:response regulator RpfG family c-di-GMP phosphodiesterase